MSRGDVRRLFTSSVPLCMVEHPAHYKKTLHSSECFNMISTTHTCFISVEFSSILSSVDMDLFNVIHLAADKGS